MADMELAEELLQIEEADAWFEYLEATRGQVGEIGTPSSSPGPGPGSPSVCARYAAAARACARRRRNRDRSGRMLAFAQRPMADVFDIQRCARPAAGTVVLRPRAVTTRGDLLALVSMAKERTDECGSECRDGGRAAG